MMNPRHTSVVWNRAWSCVESCGWPFPPRFRRDCDAPPNRHAIPVVDGAKTAVSGFQFPVFQDNEPLLLLMQFATYKLVWTALGQYTIDSLVFSSFIFKASFSNLFFYPFFLVISFLFFFIFFQFFFFILFFFFYPRYGLFWTGRNLVLSNLNSITLHNIFMSKFF